MDEKNEKPTKRQLAMFRLLVQQAVLLYVIITAVSVVLLIARGPNTWLELALISVAVVIHLNKLCLEMDIRDDSRQGKTEDTNATLMLMTLASFAIGLLSLQ